MILALTVQGDQYLCVGVIVRQEQNLHAKGAPALPTIS
jgi:hypothetical protein